MKKEYMIFNKRYTYIRKVHKFTQKKDSSKEKKKLVTKIVIKINNNNSGEPLSL